MNHRFQARFLKPRYWPIWCMLALIFLIGRLPLKWVLALGRRIGRLLLRTGGYRVHVTRRNIELCFPEKTEKEREQILHSNFEALGIALLEPGIAWFSSRRRIARISRFEGMPHLQKGMQDKQDMLLSCLHMTCVEMMIRIACEHFPCTILYRPQNNPVYEYVSGVCRNRFRHSPRLVPRKQVKEFLQFIRQGEIGVILPDQDMGDKRSIFIPFFGIPAATITSTSSFARQTDAKVLFGQYWLDENSRYRAVISEPLPHFPTDDERADTLRITELTETFIRRYPAQYLWQHRRFKTRPAGEKALYGEREQRKNRRA